MQAGEMAARSIENLTDRQALAELLQAIATRLEHITEALDDDGMEAA